MAALQRTLVMRTLPQGSYATGRNGNLFADTPMAGVGTTSNRRYELTGAGCASIHQPYHDNNRVLSPEELDENVGGTYVDEYQLQQLFDHYDKDGSGLLELDEVRLLYESFDNCGVEYTDEDLKREIGRYAIRNDGKVDFDEFCCIILSIAQR
eukprot:TRINITY_DN18585_c0_g1_i1.p1 TRINITY_DN18585_c0_g1~~TRINITY_DN18585_c0_g1_i1.p1  ORF type:complete len:153 (+),score=60.95 TRINITY_DN18585_c0_g1_i1:54-512(+)